MQDTASYRYLVSELTVEDVAPGDRLLLQGRAPFRLQARCTVALGRLQPLGPLLLLLDARTESLELLLQPGPGTAADQGSRVEHVEQGHVGRVDREQAEEAAVPAATHAPYHLLPTNLQNPLFIFSAS